jgi:hypothetical protein
MADSDRCALCDEPGMVWINGAGYCPDHADDGFRAVARGLGIAKGMDPDVAEERIVKMLEDIFPEDR